MKVKIIEKASSSDLEEAINGFLAQEGLLNVMGIDLPQTYFKYNADKRTQAPHWYTMIRYSGHPKGKKEKVYEGGEEE